MDTQKVSPRQLVSEILDTVPRAEAIFARHGMSCPGCAMARFMTLAEAAAAHRLAADDLIAALRGGGKQTRRVHRHGKGVAR